MGAQGRVKLPHHQIAMFFDRVFMTKIVSVNRAYWQGDLNRKHVETLWVSRNGERPVTCFIVS
jgi:hypothetical protein